MCPWRSRGVGAGWAASTCLVSLVAEDDHDAGGQARDRDRRDGHVQVAVHRQHPVNGVDVAAAARAETRTSIYATNDGPFSTSGRRGQDPHTWYQVAREVRKLPSRRPAWAVAHKPGHPEIQTPPAKPEVTGVDAESSRIPQGAGESSPVSRRVAVPLAVRTGKVVAR